mmetsp:Transcript_10498/g.23886  ORF Transcript_10498/g.23886 Transcript_10498/m.23886 type:complete len:671 (+) Transcript_10498:164-2176(+)
MERIECSGSLRSFKELLAEVSLALVEQHDRELQSLEGEIRQLRDEVHQARGHQDLFEKQTTPSLISGEIRLPRQQEPDMATATITTEQGILKDAESPVHPSAELLSPLRGLGYVGMMTPPPPDPATKPSANSPSPPRSLPGLVHLYPDDEPAYVEGHLAPGVPVQQEGKLGSEDGGMCSMSVSHAGSVAGSSTTNRRNRYWSTRGASDSRQSSHSGMSKGLGALGDPDKVKAIIREALSTPHRSESSIFFGEERLMARIARSHAFENVTMAVIFVNAIWISVDIDLNKADLIIYADPIFQIMENLFCFYFTAELVIRFCSYKRSISALTNPPFLFDFVLCFLMVVETWVMSLIILLLAGGSDGAAGIGQLSVFRIARLGKMFRMARMARILRSMPELVILVKGIGVAARSVFFTLLLLMIIIYVFAVGIRQVTDGTEIGRTYFSSVPTSMNSLLLRGILPDNAEMVYNMQEQDWWLWPLIMFFILLASLTVMNMLVGVLVEVVGAVASTERESMLVGSVRAKMLAVMDRLDGDGDQRVSQKEVEGLLVNPDACKLIKELGVDAVGLVDVSNFMFADKPPDATLAFEDFMDMVMNLRGSNAATVKDCIGIGRSLKQDLMKTMTQHTRDVHDVKRTLRSLERLVERSLQRQHKASRQKEVEDPIGVGDFMSG